MKIFLAALVVLLNVAAQAAAQPPQLDPSGPVLVVAAHELQGPYRGAVMIAAPFRGGHVGVVINRPSRISMAEAFPSSEACKLVRDPVYVGGPEGDDALFAMHRSPAGRAPSSIELMPGVWLEHQASIIDAMIEAEPNGARYYAGYVWWRPGELAHELERGLMALAPADAAKLFLEDTAQLHRELAPAPIPAGARQTRLER